MPARETSDVKRAFARKFSFLQTGDGPFNRATLFNIGFKEALKFDDFKCFVFHDVDLMPENDRNEYSCPSSPRHMSVAVDKFNYRQVPYSVFSHDKLWAALTIYRIVFRAGKLSGIVWTATARNWNKSFTHIEYRAGAVRFGTLNPIPHSWTSSVSVDFSPCCNKFVSATVRINGYTVPKSGTKVSDTVMDKGV